MICFTLFFSPIIALSKENRNPMHGVTVASIMLAGAKTSLSFPYSDYWEMEEGLYSYSSIIDDVFTERETYTASIDIFFSGNYAVYDFWTNIGGLKIDKETALDYMIAFISSLYSEESEKNDAKTWLENNIDIGKNQIFRCKTPNNTVIEFSQAPDFNMYYLRCYTHKIGDIIEAEEVIGNDKLPDFSISRTNSNPYTAMSKTNFIKLTEQFISYTKNQMIVGTNLQKLQNAGLLPYLDELITFNQNTSSIFPEFNEALAKYFDEPTQKKYSNIMSELESVFSVLMEYSREGGWRPFIQSNNLE